jgi:hypothetical protein
LVETRGIEPLTPALQRHKVAPAQADRPGQDDVAAGWAVPAAGCLLNRGAIPGAIFVHFGRSTEYRLGWCCATVGTSNRWRSCGRTRAVGAQPPSAVSTSSWGRPRPQRNRFRSAPSGCSAKPPATAPSPTNPRPRRRSPVVRRTIKARSLTLADCRRYLLTPRMPGWAPVSAGALRVSTLYFETDVGDRFRNPGSPKGTAVGAADHDRAA